MRLKHIVVFCLCAFASHLSYAQTCTISGTGVINWDAAVCSETGAAPANGATVVIPAGVTVRFTTNDEVPEHSGDIIVFGKMEVNKPDVYVYGNVRVKSGGELEINEKLRIGPDVDGCGKSLVVESGGVAEFPGTGSNDKLFICGNEIARAGGLGCNPLYPLGPPPYCDPIFGFTGPTGFDEDGYDAALPVTLLYFTASVDQETVSLEWATGSEENFREFEIERSSDGVVFDRVGAVPGAGRNIYDLTTHYSFVDESPVLGFNYYRLKAVDLDDSFEQFGIRSVRLTGAKSMRAFPNPAGRENVSVVTNFNPADGDRLVIRDAFGTALLSIPATSNVSTLQDLSRLASGVYFIQYTGSHTETVRIVIR